MLSKTVKIEQERKGEEVERESHSGTERSKIFLKERKGIYLEPLLI